MNILDKLDTKKTAAVFGWPLDTLTKAAQLAQKIDISHVLECKCFKNSSSKN